MTIKAERPFRKSTALLLLFIFAVPCFSYPSIVLPIQEAPEYDVYDVEPISGMSGKQYAITVISHDPNKKKITPTTQIIAPGGIAVSDIKAMGNGMTANITIPENTPLGRMRFLLTDKKGPEGAIIGTAYFEVKAVSPGPIPPGLDPEVDVMWGVMAEKVVMHNFGHKIAKHYYGIQLRIGNNTGYDLQIAGVGFKLPENTGIKNTIPSNSYRSTRGTLERQQEIGTRAIIMNSLKAAGLLFTGFLPFWHAAGASANATRFADVINGPVEGGVGSIWADTIISQLTRLDDQMLRDGLIVKNNSQVSTLVFVPKQLLNISKNEGLHEIETAFRRDHLETKDKKFDFRNDPQYVNLRLGELVLVGQPIQFLNRIQVIRSSEAGPARPRSVEDKPQPQPPPDASKSIAPLGRTALPGRSPD